MALIRVAQYNSTPTVVEDYQAQNAHLQAFTNQLMTQQFILDAGTDQPVIKQGCYVSHGGSLYIADADTSITGSPSDGSVYIRVSGTTSLTVEFVNNISGYTWNPVYSALTNGNYTLLPYLIVKATAVVPPWITVWTRYNFNPNNQAFGNAIIDGHDIDSELDTLNGRVNQGVKTTDSPAFAKLTLTTSTEGSQSITGGTTWTPPAGIYVIESASLIGTEFYIGGSWVPVTTDQVKGVQFFDGTNFRLTNTGSTKTVRYRKFS